MFSVHPQNPLYKPKETCIKIPILRISAREKGAWPVLRSYSSFYSKLMVGIDSPPSETPSSTPHMLILENKYIFPFGPRPLPGAQL